MGLLDLFNKNKADEEFDDEPKKLSDDQAIKVVEKIKELSRKSAYRLTLVKSRKPGIFDTKFGGVPYWDMKLDYPTSSNDEKLILLAQINLSDVKDCELLPSTGMLQFFIAAGDLYGMDFKNYISNDTFRVVYHEKIDESVTAQDVLSLGISTSVNPSDDYDEFLFPLNCEIAVDVEKTEVTVGNADFMYEKILYKAAESLGIELTEDASAYDLLPEDAFDASSDNNVGNWLFGYAFFTQSDPREYISGLEDYILLFQMDSNCAGEKEYEILWGDCGVGNFFIKPDDLKNLDFSKVMYTWDCG